MRTIIEFLIKDCQDYTTPNEFNICQNMMDEKD